MHIVGPVQTSALLTGDISNVLICQREVWVEVRSSCVPQGAPQPLQKEILSIADGHSEIYEAQVLRCWGFIAFFCSLLRAMHPAGTVKTSALLTGDI